jgi:hypothetical protein
MNINQDSLSVLDGWNVYSTSTLPRPPLKERLKPMEPLSYKSFLSVAASSILAGGIQGINSPYSYN